MGVEYKKTSPPSDKRNDIQTSRVKAPPKTIVQRGKQISRERKEWNRACFISFICSIPRASLRATALVRENTDFSVSLFLRFFDPSVLGPLVVRHRRDESVSGTVLPQANRERYPCSLDTRSCCVLAGESADALCVPG